MAKKDATTASERDAIAHPITSQLVSRGRVPTLEIIATEISPIEEARFWALVDVDWRPDACWNWIGENVTGAGYGRFKYRNSKVSANRFAYALYWGWTPKDLFVCHTCDNPRCVRQEHLFLGSPAVNSEDKVRKGRHAHGSRTGTAILSEAQVIEIKRLLQTDLTARQIGTMFGVTKTTIQKISSGVNWGHIDADAGYRDAPLLSYCPPARVGRPGHVKTRGVRPKWKSR